MFSEAIEIIQESIFPIFYRRKQGNLTQLGVSGTGFFVSDKGIFVTANHVISGVPQGSELLYAGNVPEKVTQPVKIQEIYKDATKDVFVGKVTKPLPKLELSEEKPKAGSSVCLCGYPMAQIKQNPDKSINVRNVRKYWQPTFVIDNLHMDKDGRKIKGFIVQHTSLRGMSGGPTFNTKGEVYGIDVATMTRQIPEPGGIPTVVRNGAVMGVKQVIKALKDAKVT